MGSTVDLVIHLESVGTEVVWWAESPDVEGFTAAAPSLAELRGRATAALRDIVGPDVQVTERLVGGEVRRTPDGDEVRIVQTESLPC